MKNLVRILSGEVTSEEWKGRGREFRNKGRVISIPH